MAERMGQQPGDAAKIHWVGHATASLQQVDRSAFENETFVAHPVFMDEAVHKGFYEGFSNNLLWPLFHYFPSYGSFDEANFSHYQQANARFLAETADLVVSSGRDRSFLEKTLTDIPVYLVAEHGAFLKKPAQHRERLDLSTDNWHEPVRAVMRQLVGQFAGSFVEEEKTAIAWHYRMAGVDDVEAHAVELANGLRGIASAVPLAVIQGNKVVEVKPTQHSKGTVALTIVEQKTYDFIVSIGDDTTGEDMVRLLPNWAYTLKVGPGTSFARYRLARQHDVEALLQQMSDVLTEM
ncbi:trehalose-phosphatase [uncultured Fibrella sp.]|uniref:trehalose-phosphatase n=1 Tax=uncultured Fibrella sp. TaxID=1284596 RepID=UPI0035CB523B